MKILELSSNIFFIWKFNNLKIVFFCVKSNLKVHCYLSRICGFHFIIFIYYILFYLMWRNVSYKNLLQFIRTIFLVQTPLHDVLFSKVKDGVGIGLDFKIS